MIFGVLRPFSNTCRVADDIGKKKYDIYTSYGVVDFNKTLDLANTWK
jgi:hypothetical protein